MAHTPPRTPGHLQALSPDIRPYADYLVAVVRDAGFPLEITSSVRTRAEQAALVRIGASQTPVSAHLIGQAFDVDVHGYGRDEVPLWFWYAVGEFAESLGFVWGGRWSGLRDYGHFEHPYWRQL